RRKHRRFPQGRRCDDRSGCVIIHPMKKCSASTAEHFFCRINAALSHIMTNLILQERRKIDISPLSIDFSAMLLENTAIMPYILQ
ncbi:MAG: hypothetical protein IJC21_06945, partial [Lentisphaeria bacterium]|nr:hypothetical protein [Lentisphaeria bacterium]